MAGSKRAKYSLHTTLSRMISLAILRFLKEEDCYGVNCGIEMERVAAAGSSCWRHCCTAPLIGALGISPKSYFTQLSNHATH